MPNNNWRKIENALLKKVIERANIASGSDAEVKAKDVTSVLQTQVLQAAKSGAQLTPQQLNILTASQRASLSQSAPPPPVSGGKAQPTIIPSGLSPLDQKLWAFAQSRGVYNEPTVEGHKSLVAESKFWQTEDFKSLIKEQVSTRPTSNLSAFGKKYESVVPPPPDFILRGIQEKFAPGTVLPKTLAYTNKEGIATPFQADPDAIQKDTSLRGRFEYYFASQAAENANAMYADQGFFKRSWEVIKASSGYLVSTVFQKNNITLGGQTESDLVYSANKYNFIGSLFSTLMNTGILAKDFIDYGFERGSQVYSYTPEQKAQKISEIEADIQSNPFIPKRGQSVDPRLTQINTLRLKDPTRLDAADKDIVKSLHALQDSYNLGVERLGNLAERNKEAAKLKGTRGDVPNIFKVQIKEQETYKKQDLELQKKASSLYSEGMSASSDMIANQKFEEAITAQVASIEARRVNGSYDAWGAVTWSRDKEKYNGFLRAAAELELQLGRPLDTLEIRRLKDAWVNPWQEASFQVVFDLTNYISFGAIAKGAWVAIKEGSESIGLAPKLVKASEAAAKVIDRTPVIGWLSRKAVSSVGSKLHASIFDLASRMQGAYGTGNIERFGEDLNVMQKLADNLSPMNPVTAEKTFDYIQRTGPIGLKEITYADFKKFMNATDSLSKETSWSELYKMALEQVESAQLEILKKKAGIFADATKNELLSQAHAAAYSKRGIAIANDIFGKNFRDAFVDLHRIYEGSRLLDDSLLGQFTKAAREMASTLPENVNKSKYLNPAFKLNTKVDEALIYIGERIPGLSKATLYSANTLEQLSKMAHFARDMWSTVVLSTNRWWITNFLDSSMRGVVWGGNMMDDFLTLARSTQSQFIDDIGFSPMAFSQSLAKESISIMDDVPIQLIYSADKPKWGLASYWNHEWERLKALSKEPTNLSALGKSVSEELVRNLSKKDAAWYSQIWDGFSTFMRAGAVGVSDFNTSIEITIRTRMFHREYFKLLGELEPLFKVRGLENLTEATRPLAQYIWREAKGNPAKINGLVDSLTSGKLSGTNAAWSFLLPTDWEDNFKVMSPDLAQVFTEHTRGNLEAFFKATLENTGKVPTNEAIHVYMVKMVDSYIDDQAKWLSVIQQDILSQPGVINTNKIAIDAVDPTDVTKLNGAAPRIPDSTARTEAIKKLSVGTPRQSSKKVLGKDGILETAMADRVTVTHNSPLDKIVIGTDPTTGKLTMDIGDKLLNQSLSKKVYPAIHDAIIELASMDKRTQSMIGKGKFFNNPEEFKIALKEFMTNPSQLAQDQGRFTVMVNFLDNNENYRKILSQTIPNFSDYEQVKAAIAYRLSGTDIFSSNMLGESDSMSKTFEAKAREMDGTFGNSWYRHQAGIDYSTVSGRFHSTVIGLDAVEYSDLKSLVNQFGDMRTRYRTQYGVFSVLGNPGPRLRGGDEVRRAAWDVYDAALGHAYIEESKTVKSVEDVLMAGGQITPESSAKAQILLKELMQDYPQKYLHSVGVDVEWLDEAHTIINGINVKKYGRPLPGGSEAMQIGSTHYGSDSPVTALLRERFFAPGGIPGADPNPILGIIPRIDATTNRQIQMNLRKVFGVTTAEADDYRKLLKSHIEWWMKETGGTKETFLARLGFQKVNGIYDLPTDAKIINSGMFKRGTDGKYVFYGSEHSNLDSLVSSTSIMFYGDLKEAALKSADSAETLKTINEVLGVTSGKMDVKQAEKFSDLYIRYRGGTLTADELRSGMLKPALDKMSGYMADAYDSIKDSKNINLTQEVAEGLNKVSIEEAMKVKSNADVVTMNLAKDAGIASTPQELFAALKGTERRASVPELVKRVLSSSNPAEADIQKAMILSSSINDATGLPNKLSAMLHEVQNPGEFSMTMRATGMRVLNDVAGSHTNADDLLRHIASFAQKEADKYGGKVTVFHLGSDEFRIYAPTEEIARSITDAVNSKIEKLSLYGHEGFSTYAFKTGDKNAEAAKRLLNESIGKGRDNPWSIVPTTAKSSPPPELITAGASKEFKDIANNWSRYDPQTKADIQTFLISGSFTDPVTGLPTFKAKLNHPKPDKWVEGISDMNALKASNIVLGESMGDEVIAAKANAIKNQIKKFEDIHGAGKVGDVFRTGGDEFTYYFSSKKMGDNVLKGASRELYNTQIFKDFLAQGGDTAEFRSGFSMSYGIGDNLDSAEAALKIQKEDMARKGFFRVKDKTTLPPSIRRIERRATLLEKRATPRNVSKLSEIDPVQLKAVMNRLGAESQMDNAMKEAWDTFKTRRDYTGFSDADKTSAATLKSALTNKINRLNSGELSNTYEYMIRDIQDWEDAMIKQFNGNIPYAPPKIPEFMMSPGNRAWVRKSIDTVGNIEEAVNALKKLESHLMTGNYIPPILSKETSTALKQWAEEATKAKAEMVSTILNGGKIGNRRYEGAIQTVNRIMLDYTDRNNFDGIMKNFFPFWMFPSRSLPFWIQTLSTHPELIAFYNKIQHLSRSQRYQAGAITSKGAPLSSMDGYIQIPNTDTWFNPLAPFSFRYVLDVTQSNDENMYKMQDPNLQNAPIESFVARELLDNAQIFSFSVAPWISYLMKDFFNISDSALPQFPIAPEIPLIPRHLVADMLDKTRKFFGHEFSLKGLYPESPWHDYTVDVKLLEDALQAMDDPALSEGEKLAKLNEARNALKDRKQNDLWNQTYNEVTNSEAGKAAFSFFTGFYPKEFTDGQADLYALRNQRNILISTLNSRFQASIFDLPQDAQSAYDNYLKMQDTPQGWLYRLYTDAGWVKNDKGEPATGEDRNKFLIQAINDDINQQSYYTERKILQDNFNETLKSIPAGTSYDLMSKTYDNYFEALARLELHFPFPYTTGFGSNKPVELIQQDLANRWFKMLYATRPAYDTSKNYQDNQLMIADWESRLPDISQALLRVFLRDGHITNITTNLHSDQKFDPKFFQNLLKASTPVGIKQWQMSNDTPFDALNNAWQILYWDKYWNEVGPLTGAERDLANKDFADNVHPPTDEEMYAWITANYGPDRFTFADITDWSKVEPLTVNERTDQQTTQETKLRNEIWNLLSWIGPYKKSKIVNKIDATLSSLPGRALSMADWMAFDGRTIQGEQELQDFITQLKTVYVKLGIQAPSREYMVEFVQAQAENNRFKELIDKQFESVLSQSNFDLEHETNFTPSPYNQIMEIQDEYYAYVDSGKAAKKQWIRDNPEKYKIFTAYNNAKTAFGQTADPMWRKYYLWQPKTPEILQSAMGLAPLSQSTDATVTSSVPPSTGYSQVPSGGGSQPSTVPSSSASSSQRVSIPWPSGMKETVGSTLVKEIENLYSGKGKLSSGAFTFLKNLRYRHPDWNVFINDVLYGNK